MSSFVVLEGLLLGIVPLHSKFTATPKTFSVSIMKGALQISAKTLSREINRGFAIPEIKQFRTHPTVQ